MVPHFTGRQKECEDIASHLTSGSARIVSIWGSPGFGKTSVAIAIGHHLHSQGLPVYYLSLRGVKSKADLASKLLSLFKLPASEQQNQQYSSVDDEISYLLSELSEPFTIVLDNADELLSGGPEVKEDFTHFLADILRRTEKLTLVITTRESLEFMNVQFQDHQGVRISPLHESSSLSLVNELLSNATVTDCKRVSKICGHVPLAMKLLCSSISEDDAELSQVLDDLMESLQNHNIVEILDNPDYPSDLRLKLLFDSSFQRLSSQEKEALVSLSVLPESFDLTVAAAVLDISEISVAKRVLHNLRRKSLLESSSEPETFLMHQLILSFANQRGQTEMKEVLLKSKARLCAFYVSRFKYLNEQFLTGQSMPAFIDFYKDEQNITQSLMDGSSNPETAKEVFEVLVNAEMFLCSLYRRKRAAFCKIYDSAKKAAKMLENKNFYRKLAVSKAFCQLTCSTRGGSMPLPSKAGDLEESCSPVLDSDRGKSFFYNAIYQLANDKTEDGVQSLEYAVSLMKHSPEHKILRIITSQILAIYHRFKKNPAGTSQFYSKALLECKTLGNTELLVIPKGLGKELPEAVKEDLNQRKPDASNNQPLRNEVISIIEAATKQFCDNDTKQSLTDATLKIAEEIKKPTLQTSLGLFHFQTNVMALLCHLKKYEDAEKLSASRISFQETTHERSKTSKQGKEKNLSSPTLNEEEMAKSYSKHASINYSMQKYFEAQKFEQRALEIKKRVLGDEHQSTADSHHSLGRIQEALGDFPSALQSTKRALDIRLKRYGEENSSTADSYHLLGLTQRAQGDFPSALYSTHRALDIRRKLFGEEHQSTAESYHSLGLTQDAQGDFSSALLSKQRALQVRLNLFGEDHSSTADSYISLWVTQQKVEDFSSALQSAQRALYITRKIFGEKDSRTAESYLSLGTTQHAQGNFSSALQSAQLALKIRVKLFGEEHSDTADSYHLLGDTQLALGDLSSALQSRQRALNIRLKLLGEKHSRTAESYHSLGITQLEQGDLSSALKSAQRALNIRLELFGEKHPSTAESYHLLGDTQHALRHFASALQSKQCALDIRLELFGEEHSSTADSYDSLGNTQHAQGNFASAVQSTRRALDICLKLFGEEHLSTALSYFSLGVTQHELGEFSSAIQSTQSALDIRLKLLGEEHSSTADSYHSLGATQHALGDFSSAILSKQRALNIRLKLFNEEHSGTALSYSSLGETQYAQGDFASAVESKQRALDIRLKMFGEEHSSTADSYRLLGITQHALGDFSAAFLSKQLATDIMLKLFGEEHSSTADCYHSLSITQHALGELSLALESSQRALDIRLKLFGEEHSSTADSYHLLGVTQHALGDFPSAFQSKQRALGIRLDLFGEENSSTASCYHSLGVTQHALGDFSSATLSKRCALNIKLKLFGEEHSSTADSYHALGVTQLALGDVSSARLSYRCALDIRLKMFGEGHPSTITSYYSLRRIEHKPGNFVVVFESN